MRQRRVFSVVTTTLCGLLLLGGTARLLADCRPSHPGDARRFGGYVHADGKVHYKVGYSGVTTPHIIAIQHAMNMWNNEANTTGVVFEETNGAADFIFYPGSGGTGVCAQYNDGASNIWYNASYMAFAVNYPQLAGRIYAHELGHALGLEHKGPGSIMATGAHTATTCGQGAGQLPTDVQPDDASEAHDCERAAHAGSAYGPPPSYFINYFWPQCYEVWLREEYWRCPDGCYLDFVQDILWYTNCF